MDKRILRDKRVIFLALLAFAMAIFARPLLIGMILILAGAFSTYYKRFFSVGIDIELCSLCAVALGSLYGATAGAIGGAISIAGALALNGHLMENAFFALIKVMTYAGLGLVGALFASGNLLLIALIYIVITDILFVVIAMQTGGNPGKLFVFLLTHALIVVSIMRPLLPLIERVG